MLYCDEASIALSGIWFTCSIPRAAEQTISGFLNPEEKEIKNQSFISEYITFFEQFISNALNVSENKMRLLSLASEEV